MMVDDYNSAMEVVVYRLQTTGVPCKFNVSLLKAISITFQSNPTLEELGNFDERRNKSAQAFDKVAKGAVLIDRGMDQTRIYSQYPAQVKEALVVEDIHVTQRALESGINICTGEGLVVD